MKPLLNTEKIVSPSEDDCQDDNLKNDIFPPCEGELASSPTSIKFDASPSKYSTVITYLVSLITVNGVANGNENTVQAPVGTEETAIVPDVANATPVGTEFVPKVPEWA